MKIKLQTIIKNAVGILFVAAAGLLGTRSYAQTTPISSVTITVNDSSSTTLPTAATASADPASFCTGGSTTLTVSGGYLGTGAKWKWYEDACPSGTATPIDSGASITVSPTNTTTEPITKTYYVRAEGTCNTTACIPVTITINPTPAVTAPADIAYCNGATAPAITLTGTPSGVVTYSISGGSSIGLADASNVTEVPSFTAVNTGTSPVTVPITITPSANGCTGTAVTYNITVLPTATVNPVSDQTKCNGSTTDAITFSSPTTGGTVTYSWTNDNPNIGLAASGTGDIGSFTATNTNCTDAVATIIVTPTYTDGSNSCEGTTADTFTITVHPSPNGTIAAEDAAVCQDGTAQLIFTSSCGTGPFSLDIRNNGTTHTYPGEVSGTAFDITPAPTVPGPQTYDLMSITDANGCSNPQ